MSDDCRLICGDAVAEMAKLPDGSIDAIISDPPYPEISRPYGRLTEEEWWTLMMGVCAHARRVLKPTGSAVFILQPNSRKVGSMRGWLFEFQAWACREWNMVQDAWWWNTNTLTAGFANRGGLRSSVKACAWLGPADCYRDQMAILDSQDYRHYCNPAQTPEGRAAYHAGLGQGRRKYQSGHQVDHLKAVSASVERGGSVPFNLIAVPNGSPPELRDRKGHPAGTPLRVADFWTRYISPPGGTILDPFCGSGTMGLAALNRGRSFIGIDKEVEYVAIARRRIDEALARTALFPAGAPA